MRTAILLFLFGASAAAQVFHPTLSFSTFLAGTAINARVATDANGNIYLASTVNSSQGYDANLALVKIPPCPNAACRDELVTRGYDVYLMKLSPDGTRTIWTRQIGGSGDDFFNAIAVSPAGEVYLAGSTTSPDFPLTKNAFSTTPIVPPNSGASSFLMYLGADGNTLTSTYVDAGATTLRVAVDGTVMFTGVSTWTQMTPTPGTVSLPGNGITGRLNADLSKVVLAVRGVGGALLAVDAGGNLIAAGTTVHGYTTTPGAYQNEVKTNYCGSAFLNFECGHQYVSKLSADGTKLIFSTYVSGTSDGPNGIAVDAEGNIYLGGEARFADYPVTPGAFQTQFQSTVPIGIHGGVNADSGYVTKLAADGGSVIWSTLIGGRGADSVTGLGLAPDGTVYVVMRLTLADFPQLHTLGRAAGAPVVLGVSKDGSAVLSSFTMPAPPDPASTSTFSFLTLNSAASAIVVRAPVTRAFPVTPGVVSAMPDVSRIASGMFVAKLDLTRPAVTAPAVVTLDAADPVPLAALAPGQLVTFESGYGLGAATAVAASPDGGAYPTQVAGTQVLFDGLPAPLLYTAPDQINVAAPYGLAGRNSTVLSVVQDGAPIFSQVIPITARTPRAFVPEAQSAERCSIDNGVITGAVDTAVIDNQDGSKNTCTNPAKRGATVDLYLNGVGAVPGGAPEGAVVGDPAPALSVPFTIQLNGKPADVVSASEVPGWIAGVWRVRVRIPADYNGNMAYFQIAVDGVAASPQTLYAWVTTR